MPLDHFGADARFGAVTHHILLVEDDPDAAGALRQSLENYGFKVTCARDGGQAHSAFVMRKPDFVILDLILPGASGFEVCQHMKQTDATIPVMAYSEIDLPDARRLAERVGMDGYLTKPCPADAVVQKIREIAETVWQRYHATHQPVETDRVRFQCPCGKKFKVSAAHRGKSMSCPNCGEPVIVPRG